MPGSATLVKELDLATKKNGGKISVSHLTHPYGEESDPVVSIGVTLFDNSGNPDWKVHIPYGNVDEVIAALQEAKAKYA